MNDIIKFTKRFNIERRQNITSGSENVIRVYVFCQREKVTTELSEIPILQPNASYDAIGIPLHIAICTVKFRFHFVFLLVVFYACFACFLFLSFLCNCQCM